MTGRVVDVTLFESRIVTVNLVVSGLDRVKSENQVPAWSPTHLSATFRTLDGVRHPLAHARLSGETAQGVWVSDQVVPGHPLWEWAERVLRDHHPD